MVIKSNFLVEAAYRLSAIEQKIILFLATQIKSTDKEFQKYSFNLGDLGAFLGLKSNADYTYLREVTKTLLSKVLILKKEGSTLQTHWLESVEYFEDLGVVAINFNPDLKPFLIQLKNNFTKYQLKYAIRLKSQFSIRIYELLKQYESIGVRDFLLQELREKLGVKSDEYPLYGNFKAKILLVAQRELKAKTDLFFDFEEIKLGRGIGKIRFFIRMNPHANQPISASVIHEEAVPSEDLNKLIQQLPKDYREKESIKKLLKAWLEKKDFDFVSRNIAFANDCSNAVNPGANILKGSNYRAYLAKALVGDFGLPYKEDGEARAKEEMAAQKRVQEEANTLKKRKEQEQREKENAERARVYQQNLSPEALATLREEAIARLDPPNQDRVRQNGLGGDFILKLLMNTIALERMKIS